jgi:hypothetical protein
VLIHTVGFARLGRKATVYPRMATSGNHEQSPLLPTQVDEYSSTARFDDSTVGRLSSPQESQDHDVEQQLAVTSHNHAPARSIETRREVTPFLAGTLIACCTFITLLIVGPLYAITASFLSSGIFGPPRPIVDYPEPGNLVFWLAMLMPVFIAMGLAVRVIRPGWREQRIWLSMLVLWLLCLVPMVSIGCGIYPSGCGFGRQRQR